MSISRLLVFQWVLIVPHWRQICSYIHMKLIVYHIYKQHPLISPFATYIYIYIYIYDVLSLNNPKFNDYIDVIDPKEFEIKDTTDAPKWANYLDLHLEFDEHGKLFTRLHDKRDEFNFPIVNFQYLSSNIPESPAYGFFVSQLIRYARACSKYEDFLFRGSILVSKLLKQGYSSRKHKTTFRKFYDRHTYLVYKYDTSVSHMLNGLFTNCDI